jgi:hypothetical protein
MKSEIRYCEDIGMHALDLPRNITCRYATEFCLRTCYNNGIESRYEACNGKDIRNMEYFLSITPEIFRDHLARRTAHQTRRFRFCTRGEAIYSMPALHKLIAIDKICPKTIFWIPTRAWRDSAMKLAIESTLMTMGNVRIMASLDPSNTDDEAMALWQSGWSLIFYGNNDEPIAPSLPWIKCKKTWNHENGHCSKCRKGCFQRDQVAVWLKRH